MTVVQILEKVQQLGHAKHAEIFRKTSGSPDDAYAVGLTKLRAIAREAKRDHERALALWSSNIHEGKILATLTEEPKLVTEDQLEEQVKQIYTFDLADYFAKHVVAKTDFLLEKANEWTHMKQPEWVRRVGYACVCNLAKKSKTLDNNYFQKHLVIIELEMAKASNWVKEGQNYALMAIGSRNKVLNQKALKVAEVVGKIKVDYGDTSCKTPDASGYLKSEKVQGKL